MNRLKERINCFNLISLEKPKMKENLMKNQMTFKRKAQRKERKRQIEF